MGGRAKIKLTLRTKNMLAILYPIRYDVKHEHIHSHR